MINRLLEILVTVLVLGTSFTFMVAVPYWTVMDIREWWRERRKPNV